MNKRTKKEVLVILFLLFFVPYFSHAHQLKHLGDETKVTRHISLMSTRVEFSIVTQKQLVANKAIDEAIAEIKRIVSVMSEWEPDSLISRVNQNAHKRPVVITNELYQLLLAAQDISASTQGKFDITFASAGQLWDFRKGIIPSKKAIEQAIAPIDYRHLKLDAKGPTAYIDHPETKVGLGGIAKGYAVDRAADIIRQHGFSEFSVNAGGDLYVEGQHKNSLWRIGIQNPRASDKLIALLPIANAAVATSGDYERFFIKDGVRYSHILDPDTGHPARKCQSVTVLAPKTFMADALATGVFVLGPDQGIKLINNLPGTEAVVIDASGKIYVSEGLPEL